MIIEKKSENIMKICLQDYSGTGFTENVDISFINSGNNSIAEGIESLTVSADHDGFSVGIEAQYGNVYGLGERFDKVNQKGSKITVQVLEKFCRQGEMSYCPIPFFFTDSRFGLYVDTRAVTHYSFDDRITVSGYRDSRGSLPDIYLFLGPPAVIISEFSNHTGAAALPPKWVLGPWISANRWNKSKHIEEQLEEIEKAEFPVNVLVIEAWSDETTFYIWNGAQYPENDGSAGIPPTDINYDGQWQSPEKLIRCLHEKGIKLILWQIPVFKKCDEPVVSEQHKNDCKYAESHGLCVKNRDGSQYRIPEGHWFAGSMLPDFTNPETVKWWFGKRQYLLEMGVDGFKTDGGEFVYTDDAVFHDGTTSTEMKNGYAKSYLEAYGHFAGKDRVLFSRAGYTCQQAYPVQWAGDQESAWEELRHVLSAGLSAGLSGIIFWSFDIAGFAGELPGVELYERATQLAVFCPVMQWHSEPVGGQFSETSSPEQNINDRSPWNMARVYKDAALLDRLRFHYNLRMNLLPYIYSQALECVRMGLPLMRHLVVNYPKDRHACDIEDEFMLGDILLAPVLHEGQKTRRVYLPSGRWQEFFNGKFYEGGQWYDITCMDNRIPAFVKEGSAVALNLSDSMKPGSDVGNNINGYKNLCFLLSGSKGMIHFVDDMGNDFILRWEGDKINISGNCAVNVHTKYLTTQQVAPTATIAEATR